MLLSIVVYVDFFYGFVSHGPTAYSCFWTSRWFTPNLSVEPFSKIGPANTCFADFPFNASRKEKFFRAPAHCRWQGLERPFGPGVYVQVCGMFEL